MNIVQVRFKIKENESHKQGIFFRFSIGNSKSRLVRIKRISEHFSVYWIPVTPHTEVYYVPSTVPFLVFQSSLDKCTIGHLCLMTSYPSLTQSPPESPHLSTWFTDHSCIYGYNRVALFIHRWGWGGVCTPQPPHPLTADSPKPC